MATHPAWNLVLSPMSINPWKEGLRLETTGSTVLLCIKSYLLLMILWKLLQCEQIVYLTVLIYSIVMVIKSHVDEY